jgi:phosphotransferase system enzyme I (PtsI)
MEIFTGIPVSPGVAIGPVFRLETEERNVPERPIVPEEVEGEIARMDDALAHAREEMSDLITVAGVENEISAIFSTHDMVLKDPKLREEVAAAIRSRLVSAECAIASFFDVLVQRFESVEDQYFAQRASDMRDIERRVLRALLGDRQEEISKLSEPVVIAAHDLMPTQTADLDTARTLAFLSEVGGPTSHTAIIARNLGMPAVVGLGNIMERLEDGTHVIVDGNRGQVIVDPDPAQVRRYERILLGFERYRKELTRVRDYPAETRDGHVIRLMGNIEAPADVASVMEAGGDGVGLFRTEFLYEEGKPPPTEDDHVEAYVAALRQLAGRPLTVRTFDFGADKVTPDAQAAAEPNPFLGSRSLRLCLERPGLFMPQLRAILRASGYGAVRCLFPMVSGLEDLRRAKEMLEKARVSLRTEGHYVSENLPVGVMIEIPSAAIVADLLADEVDFLSIGTNDLVQYSLAVDRVNERVAHLYQPAHPALLRLVRDVVQIGSDRSVSVSLCGEMAGDVLYTILLVGMGLREFSVSARSIPSVKQVIRRITVEQSREAAAWCSSANSHVEVLARLREALGELVPAMV